MQPARPHSRSDVADEQRQRAGRMRHCGFLVLPVPGITETGTRPLREAFHGSGVVARSTNAPDRTYQPFRASRDADHTTVREHHGRRTGDRDLLRTLSDPRAAAVHGFCNFWRTTSSIHFLYADDGLPWRSCCDRGTPLTATRVRPAVR